MHRGPDVLIDIGAEIEGQNSPDVVSDLAVTLDHGNHPLEVVHHRARRTVELDLRDIVVEIFLDRGRDHPLSRLESVVQRSLRNAGPLADLIHADRRNTLLGDDGSRLLKNATATLDNCRAAVGIRTLGGLLFTTALHYSSIGSKCPPINRRARSGYLEAMVSRARCRM